MASARGHKVGAHYLVFHIRVWMNCGDSYEVDELVDWRGRGREKGRGRERGSGRRCNGEKVG